MLLETLVVALTAKIDDFKKELGAADKEAESWSKGLGGKIAKFAGGAALAGATALAGAVAGIGTAAMGAWSDFDEASDALIHATGASGDALTEMENSVKNLYGSTAGLGVSMGDIGAVMGEVNTRTGQTGSDLEELTSTIMNFSRMTGTDGVAATAALTSVLGQFGEATANGSAYLNEMYGAGQLFGISFEELTAQLQKFGPQLQNMGFSLDESIGMLGQWEKAGVNSQSMLMGLSGASAKFAADGIPMQEGLQQTIDAIKNAGSETEALGIAYDVFGRKAGAEMVAAIKNGNMEFEAAAAAVAGTTSALDDASVRVLDFPDTWEMATKKITTALVPLGSSLAELIDAILPAVTKGIEWVVAAIGPLVSGLVDWGKWIVSVVQDGDKLQKWLGGAPAWIQTVVNAVRGIIDWFKSFGETMDAQATGRLAFFKDWVDQNMPRLQAIFQNVLGAIQGFWDTFGGSIMTIVDFVFNTIWTIIDTGLKNVMDLVSAVLQILSGDFEGGFNTIIGIVERTGAMLWDIMGGLVRTIVDAITQVDWLELGRNIIMGMINGITAMSSALWQAAKNVSQSLWDRMTGWWRTGSPSRKAEDGLGVPIGQGIGLGIESGIDMRAIDGAMNGVFEGAQFSGSAAVGGPTTNYVTITVQGGNRDETRDGVMDALRAVGVMA